MIIKYTVDKKQKNIQNSIYKFGVNFYGVNFSNVKRQNDVHTNRSMQNCRYIKLVR